MCSIIRLSERPGSTSWLQVLDRLLGLPDAGHLLLLDVLRVGGSHHIHSSQLSLFFIDLPFEI